MSIGDCPNEVLDKIFAHIPVEDLAACMEVNRAYSSMADRILNRDGRRRLKEAEAYLREIIKKSGEDVADVAKARRLLQLRGLDLSQDPPVLRLAVRHRKSEIAHLILERADLTLEDLSCLDREAAEFRGCGDVYRKMVTKRVMYKVGVRAEGDYFPVHTILAEGDGDTEAIRTLVEVEKYSPAARCDDEGLTPLYLAAQEGHVAACRLLIERYGVDPNGRSAPGQDFTPMHAATINGQLGVLEYLTSVPNVDVNCMDNEGADLLDCGTPFFTQMQHVSQRMSDPETRSSKGLTPLHYAVIMGSVEMVQLLINQPGIDVSCGTSKGFSPLHLAAGKDSVDTFSAIASHPSSDVNCRDNEGRSPLHWAAFHDAQQMVRALCSHPAVDINCRANNGDTPLHTASTRTRVGALTALMVHPAVELNGRNGAGDTALHRAASGGGVEAIAALTCLPGVDPNIRNDQGLTPLHNAAQWGGPDSLKHLLLHFPWAETGCYTDAGYTPLHLAARDACDESVRLLSQLPSVDMNCRTRDSLGATPLHLAALRGRADNVRLLSTLAGVDANARDSRGDSPLHYAATASKPSEVIEALLSLPTVDVNCKNDHGHTPLREAALNGTKAAVKLLEKREE